METKSVFETLSAIDVKQFVKNIGNGQNFIPWSICVREVSKVYPDFTWEFTNFDGLPYLPTPTGFYVECAVTISGLTRKQMRPVYTFGNKANLEPHAGDIDKAQQRALAKAIALHGFGLELWAGEDYEMVEIRQDEQVNKEVQEAEDYAKWKAVALTEYSELTTVKAITARHTAHVRRATRINDKHGIKAFTDAKNNRIEEIKEQAQ